MIFKDSLTVYFHPKLNLNFLIMNIITCIYTTWVFPQHLLLCQPFQLLPLRALHASIMLIGYIHLERQEKEQQPIGHVWV